MNRETFDIYVETQLAPTLQPGDVVILDNLLQPQEPEGRGHPQAARRLVPLPAALQSGPQSDRDGIRQTQGPSPADRRKNHRCPLWSAIGDICASTRTGVLELPKDAGYAPD